MNDRLLCDSPRLCEKRPLTMKYITYAISNLTQRRGDAEIISVLLSFQVFCKRNIEPRCDRP